MSKLDELRRTTLGNIDESMGGGRSIQANIPRVSNSGPPPKPARFQGVNKSLDAAEIELDRIIPDPDQPRTEFDPEALARLADSLAKHAQISPILVRWNEGAGKFVIVAGERRWRAAMKAGIPKLKCVIREGEIDPGEILALQVIENACREDLQPIEQAHAFKSLMESQGWTQQRLAEELGIAQPSVVRALSLLSLPAAVIEMVEHGDLSKGAAYEISKVDDAGVQAEVAARVVAEGLSRDQTVEVVRQAKEKAPAKPSTKRGRGVSKPKLTTARDIKAEDGYRIKVERKKGIEPRGQALAAVAVQVEAAAQLFPDLDREVIRAAFDGAARVTLGNLEHDAHKVRVKKGMADLQFYSSQEGE